MKYSRFEKAKRFFRFALILLAAFSFFQCKNSEKKSEVKSEEKLEKANLYDYNPIEEIRRVFQSVKLAKDGGRLNFLRKSKYFYVEYAVMFAYYWYEGRWPVSLPQKTCKIVTNSDINGFEHAFVQVRFPAQYTQSGKDEWVSVETQACNFQKDWPSFSFLQYAEKYEREVGEANVASKSGKAKSKKAAAEEAESKLKYEAAKAFSKDERKFSIEDATSEKYKNKYAFLMENAWPKKYDAQKNNYENAKEIVDAAPDYIKNALAGKY